MADTILITGGAGFIGSYVATSLLAAGHRVRVLDSLIEQVHPADAPRNPVLDHVEFVHGDVRDADAVQRALVGVDKLVHLAAEVARAARGGGVLDEHLRRGPLRHAIGHDRGRRDAPPG
jgi:dTDP-L-rhamnose 4-epimerase